jgi:hypothetical protein
MSKSNLEGSNGKSGANGRRRAKPVRRTPARGKRIRVEPTRRERVDPQMIALCYWLLAQRIVQEADEAAAPRRRESTTPDDAAGPDRAATGAGS